jgi:hypothetical protein
MIRSIKKLGESRYIINDGVIISDLDYEKDGISYKIDYDDSVLSANEAKELGDEFINAAVKAGKSDEPAKID